MRTIPEQKNYWRREGLARRRQISSHRREEAALLLKNFVIQTFPQGFVLSYIPFRSELNVHAINVWLAQENRLLLPKIQGRTLVPVQTSLEELSRLSSPKDVNQLSGEEVAERFVATSLVPAVMFDRQGFRLGYGGGYYDRFLSKNPHIWTVGVGFKEQQIESLPREPHDIPLRCLYLT